MVSKTRVLLPLIVGTVVLGTLGLLFIPESIKDKNIGFPNGTLSIDNKIVKVEVADSPVAKQRWLTFREDKLPFDSAMILVYNKSDLYPIWLLNIEFNVDLLWLDEQANIVYIVKNAPPCKTALDVTGCTYKNTKPAKYVIAAASGFIEKHKITEKSLMTIISI